MQNLIENVFWKTRSTFPKWVRGVQNMTPHDKTIHETRELRLDTPCPPTDKESIATTPTRACARKETQRIMGGSLSAPAAPAFYHPDLLAVLQCQENHLGDFASRSNQGDRGYPRALPSSTSHPRTGERGARLRPARPPPRVARLEAKVPSCCGFIPQMATSSARAPAAAALAPRTSPFAG